MESCKRKGCRERVFFVFFYSAVVQKRIKDNLLFSEAIDFPFKVFILKFRVVVTADVVIEGVVV